MSQPQPAPFGAPGPSPKPARPLRRLLLGLGSVLALLLVATVLNLRFLSPGQFDASRDEVAAVPDEHGVTKDQYAESANAVRVSTQSLGAVASASNDYFLALTAGGEAGFSAGPELLASLDEAKASVDAIPALANPALAERKVGYDEAFAVYRDEVEALLGDAERLQQTAPCHPSQMGELDPAAPSTLELVQQCQTLLAEVGQGSSAVARVARDSAVYLGYWAEAIEAEDEVGANDGRSLYQQIYLGTVQVSQLGANYLDDQVSGQASDLVVFCDRASFISAGR